MTRRSLIAPALATLCLVALTGCTGSGPKPSAQNISRDASEQIARLRAEDARRLHDALALGAQGDKAYADDDFAAAADYYSQAVSAYDEFYALWNNLGTALMALDRFQQAEEAFIRATSINPADPRPMYNRGLLYRERGYPREARKHFERALERDPNYLDALWGSIRADITIREESRQTLERIRTALFLITDPKHRQFLELERERISSKLGLSESRAERRPEAQEQDDQPEDPDAPGSP